MEMNGGFLVTKIKQLGDRMCTGKYAFNIFDCRKKETGRLWRKRNICGV